MDMSYAEYWEYLRQMMNDIGEAFPCHHSDFRLQIFKLTASPYYYWLENRAVLVSSKPPPGSPSTEEYTKEGLIVTLGTDPSITGKASKIRSFVRANVNDIEHKHMTKSAKNALLMMLDGRMLDELEDKRLICWYENWVEKVK